MYIDLLHEHACCAHSGHQQEMSVAVALEDRVVVWCASDLHACLVCVHLLVALMFSVYGTLHHRSTLGSLRPCYPTGPAQPRCCACSPTAAVQQVDVQSCLVFDCVWFLFIFLCLQCRYLQPFRSSCPVSPPVDRQPLILASRGCC